MSRPYTIKTMIRNRKRLARQSEFGTWRKRGSLCQSSYENGYSLYITKRKPGIYEMQIDHDIVGLVKGQDEAKKEVRLIAAGKPRKERIA